ncbi:MAG TPA: hypothetical protein DCY93_00495 [Firmicutes bacterium]|nr:hypothetical protein [Bacillota bacterium]
MKKKLLFFLAPALLLSLVGCGGKKPSSSAASGTSPTSSTNPPTSSVVSPTSKVSPTTTPVTPPSYTIPTDLAEMHEAVAKAQKTDYVGFVAKIVGVQQYSGNTNVNLYLQNGKYGYRVNNVPSSLGLKVGDVVEVYGRGAAKDYVAINYTTDNLGKITAYSGQVTADPLTWASSILMSESSGAAVTGAGTVTAVDKAAVTVAIGSDSVTLSWLTNTVGGAEVATKMTGVSIGQEVTFSGAFFDGKDTNKVSILQADGITLGEVHKQAWAGTLTHLQVGEITGQVNSGNTLALSGTSKYVAADVNGRYTAGHVVGAKVTKHASLPDLKSVTAKVTLPALEDAGQPTITELTNDQLVEKKILVEDGLEFYFNVGDPYKGKAIIVELNWASYVETQTITIAFAADVVFEAAAELLKGTASLQTAGLNSVVEGENITVGSLASPETIPWVTGKGNLLTIKVDAPANYVADQTTVLVYKNSEAQGEAAAWSTLNPTSDAVLLELVPGKATDTFVIEIVWKTDVIAQHINVSLVEGTLLEANPDAPATTDLNLSVDTAFSGVASGTKKTELPTGDENITVVASGGTNTGKYYPGSGDTSGTWRIYQGESGKVTVTAKNGKTIVSVTITYLSQNTGIITYNSENKESGVKIDVNAATAEFGVGNTGSATNGQARIQSILIVYA